MFVIASTQIKASVSFIQYWAHDGTASLPTINEINVMLLYLACLITKLSGTVTTDWLRPSLLRIEVILENSVPTIRNLIAFFQFNQLHISQNIYIHLEWSVTNLNNSYNLQKITKNVE
ncbi:Hypothetical_protein [Hexamita inflata]|uniref:Hypothetical_protein n=1 Tax=Hexamita inflata TaxID=28002 RepID=A0AA86PXE9_9EUKA|nr:Hypothetical protein HINF_LOCUS34256 [Hexamita inflata]